MSVVSFDPTKLPSSRAKVLMSDEEIAEYVTVLDGGRAAGDGVTYKEVKAARAAAGKIKRALEAATNRSLRSKVWQSAPEAFHFAILTKKDDTAAPAADAPAAAPADAPEVPAAKSK